MYVYTYYLARKAQQLTKRITSEIFLRGMLRALWDIDRILRASNQEEERLCWS